MTSTARAWTILIPVKSTTRGKSRLQLPAGLRQGLALAMALDTISVAARCGLVVAVVEDEADAAAVASIGGVRVHRTSVTGLNESIRDGLKVLPGLGVTDLTTQVAVLPGDLPGLQPAELAAVLDRCAGHRFAVVADHQGVGTTLLAATEVTALHPQYGPDSFRRHLEAGATPIDLPADSTLRWDVDTVADLNAEVGPFTTAARRDRRRWSPGVNQAVLPSKTCTADSSDPGGSSGTCSSCWQC